MTDINVAYRLQMFNSTEQYPSLLYSNKIMKKEFKKQFQEKFQEEFNKVFDEAFEKRFSELFDKYYEKKVNNKVVSKIYPRERKSEQIMMQEDNDEYSGYVYKLKNGPKEAPSKLFKEFENARNQLLKEVVCAEMNGTSDYPPNSDIPDGDIHDN